MKNWRLLIVGGLLLAVVLAVSLGRNDSLTSVTACGPYRSDKTVSIGEVRFQTEVVSTPAEQEKGLGGRACIERDQAMLFAFSKPSTYAIWMKNMKFPIDILWIGTDHKVVGVEINVQPSTYPDRFINKDKPAQYVLELPANRAAELKVGLGTPINW